MTGPRCQPSAVLLIWNSWQADVRFTRLITRAETERLLESRALGHNLRGSSSVMVDDRQPRSRKPTMVGGLTHWTVEDRSPRFCQPPSKSFSYNEVVSLPYPLWWEFIESSRNELGFGTAYRSLQITSFISSSTRTRKSKFWKFRMFKRLRSFVISIA